MHASLLRWRFASPYTYKKPHACRKMANDICSWYIFVCVKIKKIKMLTNPVDHLSRQFNFHRFPPSPPLSARAYALTYTHTHTHTHTNTHLQYKKDVFSKHMPLKVIPVYWSLRYMYTFSHNPRVNHQKRYVSA